MKTKVGKMACESCGEAVVVKQNERGTLSYRCDECDAAPYARPGTGQHERWRLKIGQAAPSDKPGKPLPDNPPPAAAPKKSTNIWGLES